MDPKNNRKSYSDLEAIVTTSDDASSRHQSYWNAKFLAAPSDPDPKLVDVKDEKKDLKEAILGVSPVDQIPPPPPAYYLVDAQGQTRALYAAPTNTPSDATSIVNFKTDGVTASGPGGWWKSLGEGKRLFGMRKNIFLAVLAGVCVLIFGLLATILAVTRAGAGRNGNPPPPAFSTKELLGKGDSGPLLAASDLAAMNWTDTATGIAYSGVFYQSSSTTGSALMVAFKNEKTQTWGTVNISASAAKGTLDVLPGTPLAAASNNGLWNLLYLTSQGTIAEVYAEKPTSATGWQQGSFAEVFGRPIAMPGSGLGAMWQRCGGTNCDNALFVTWQNSESGALVYANMTNLTWGSPITLSTTAAPGTPAAVSAFTDTGPTVKTGADHTAVRWYYASGSGLTELLRGPVGKFKVVAGNFDKPITSDLETHPSPKLASLTYGTEETGWTSNLLSYISPTKGSLTAANWIPGSTQWTLKTPTLSGSPGDLSAFSSVAMTQEMRIYLLSPTKGQIHEYLTSVVDPFNWAWQGMVDLS